MIDDVQRCVVIAAGSGVFFGGSKICCQTGVVVRDLAKLRTSRQWQALMMTGDGCFNVQGSSGSRVKMVGMIKASTPRNRKTCEGKGVLAKAKNLHQDIGPSFFGSQRLVYLPSVCDVVQQK